MQWKSFFLRPSEAKKDCNEKRGLKGHAMKTKIIRYLFLPLLLVLLSCDGRLAFREFEHFEDNRWFKNDVQNYKVTIDQLGSYDLILNFSHVYGASLPEIPIEIVIENEKKEIVKETNVIRLVNSEGTALSDCTGDICDLEQIVIKEKTFSAGNYTIRLAQTFEHEFLPNVIGVGIRLKEAEKN